MKLEAEKIDRAVLALLRLGLHEQDRAWKGFDWDAMHRLHATNIEYRSFDSHGTQC